MGELPAGSVNHARIRHLASKRSVDERSRSRRAADRPFEAPPEAPTVDSAMDETIEESIGFYDLEASAVAVLPEAVRPPPAVRPRRAPAAGS